MGRDRTSLLLSKSASLSHCPSLTAYSQAAATVINAQGDNDITRVIRHVDRPRRHLIKDAVLLLITTTVIVNATVRRWLRFSN